MKLNWYRKTFGGLKFYQHGQGLRPKQILNKMSGNQVAYDDMKKAKKNYDVALGGIDGFMVGQSAQPLVVVSQTGQWPPSMGALFYWHYH